MRDFLVLAHPHENYAEAEPRTADGMVFAKSSHGNAEKVRIPASGVNGFLHNLKSHNLTFHFRLWQDTPNLNDL